MAASTTTPGVMVFDGKSYAVGLLWFTVQEDSAKQLLAQRQKKTHADFYCNRTHISQQQGFGWLGKGHKRGMAVAAAMVADQLVGEWHGVFEADNGWWYVQVRSDTITPNGDQFFATEEEAYNLFQSEMQKHTWPHAYAPEKWRINDSNVRELSLKNLLDDLVTTKLIGVNITAAFGGKSQRNIFMIGLVIVFAAMAGMIAYTLTRSDAVTIPNKSNFTPRTTIAKPAGTADNGREFVSPVQMLQQCGQAADTLLLSLPGWSTEGFVCNTTSATMSWRQGNGTLSAAKDLGLKKWPGNVGVSVKQRTLNVVLTLDKLPRLQPERLLLQEEALLALERDFQPLGALQIKPVMPPAPPAPLPRSTFDTSPPPPPPPPLPPPYLEISFMSGFSPDKLMPYLKAPGLEVTEVSWQIPRGIWQYKMKWAHERPAPPAKTPIAGAAK